MLLPILKFARILLLCSLCFYSGKIYGEQKAARIVYSVYTADKQPALLEIEVNGQRLMCERKREGQ